MKNHTDFLRETIAIAAQARADGNHPFGALLVSADGQVLVARGNTHKDDGGTGHAELNVAREAAKTWTSEQLESCTLYTSVEPCSMCSGGLYWAGIGSLVFGITEARLAELTGDNPENLTMSLPCRQVLAAGQREISIIGPFPELEPEIVRGHEGFW